MKEYRLIDLISEEQKELFFAYHEWFVKPIMREEIRSVELSFVPDVLERVSFFHKDENFIRFWFYDENENLIKREEYITAPCEGYFFFEEGTISLEHEEYECHIIDLYHSTYELPSNIIPEKLNGVFVYHAETLDELCQFIVEKYCLYNVQGNLFDDAKKIEWSGQGFMVSLRNNCFDVLLGSNIKIGLQGTKFGTNLLINVSKNVAQKNAISKGTIFTFLFKNNEKISIKSSALPINISKWTNQVSLPATPSLLFLLTSEDLISIKIDFVNGELPYYTDVTLYSPILSSLFRLWVKKNIELIAECGYPTNHEILPVDDTRESSSTNAIKEQACFVYLMHDKANGFYKIGISNRPEYREHTLQSEKPSIVLIVAKEFPIRAIAEAFEAALHKTYEKQRIRGEWFNLTPQDVENLKRSLI